MAGALQPATRIANKETEMSKVFPLGLFHKQFFPDVELKQVQLSASEFVITVADSTWRLESDIVLFYGPGNMTFAYSGNPAVRWRDIKSKEWSYVKTTEALQHVTEFDMVTQTDNEWIFSFRPEKESYRIEVILPEVTGITWSGEGVDLEEEEE